MAFDASILVCCALWTVTSLFGRDNSRVKFVLLVITGAHKGFVVAHLIGVEIGGNSTTLRNLTALSR